MSVVFGATKEAGAQPKLSAVGHFVRQTWLPDPKHPSSRVTAIAQTSDGYLWVGTEAGLYRFDGFQFTPGRVTSSMTPLRHILGLIVDHAGTLWVRTQEVGLWRYTGEYFQPASPEWEQRITAMGLAEHDGIFATGLLSGLLRVQAKGFSHRSLETTSLLEAIHQTRDGQLWVGTRDAGLYTYAGGSLRPVTQGLPDLKINSLSEAPDGHLWIGTDKGVSMWNGERIVKPSLPEEFANSHVLAISAASDSEYWVGTTSGLFHVEKGRAETLPRAPSDRKVAVTTIFRDREGDVWFGNGSQLERLRVPSLFMFGDEQSTIGDQFGPIFPDSRGRTWFAPLRGGLDWMDGTGTHTVSVGGLQHDQVYSLDGSGDEIWVGRRQGGLTQLRVTASGLIQRTWTAADGLPQNSIYAVHLAHDGSVWAGTVGAGLTHITSGGMKTYTVRNGLPANAIFAIEEDSANRVWVSTAAGLSVLNNGIWSLAYSTREVVRSGAPLLANPGGGVWVGTDAGPVLISNPGAFPRSFASLPHEPVMGMSLTPAGVLWFTTAAHVFSVSREEILSSRTEPASLYMFGNQDGLGSSAGVRRSRTLVSDPDGHVWFTTSHGLFLSERAPTDRETPAFAHVESVGTQNSGLPLHEIVIPPTSHRLDISYTGIDLRTPERVRFRYRLEGFDKGWSEPTEARLATYTNLPPGLYRFHLMASNVYGRWDESQESVTFRLQPWFWQRWQFPVFCVGVVLALAFWIYHARTQYLMRQAHMLFEERLLERTRIARELHDTLLQGFQGIILYFQTAADRIPPSDPTRGLMEEALGYSDRVMIEGRERVRGLRGAMAEPPDLSEAVLKMAKDLQGPTPIAFAVRTHGKPREIRPSLQEEISIIAREGLANAFRHSDASTITADVFYDDGQLALMINDDGCGIADEIVRSGQRRGHWGLPGMRERANKIGANLSIGKNLVHSSGTSVKLTIPSAQAYTDAHRKGIRLQLRPKSRAQAHADNHSSEE